ncbi:MAG TPA: DUF2202 domain-containing protein [Bacteroidales bacterium]|nr:DUF2202 domain-containing protein [Bacteroidales bacterium]
MKKIYSIPIVMFAVVLGVALVFSACKKDSQITPDQTAVKGSGNMGGNELPCDDLVYPVSPITAEEEEMLIYSREEEKLARDVYLMLYGQYGMNIFNNIAASEQTHMDKVLCLIVHYGLEDPASSEIGVFSNPELQQLYNDLIDLGSSSRLNAMIAGATIEDFDINDLEDFMIVATNSSVLSVFGSLCCGSRNHLRSFADQIEKRGATYTPQYISQEYYDWIINSEPENCGDMDGNSYRYNYRYRHQNGSD